MELDIKQIMDIIPHRQPFLLIDRVTEMVPGQSIKGYKNLSYNEPFFSGHFPKEPVMPGVLQIEALAQLGAVCVLSLDENKGKTAYFAGIKEAKFKQKVVPGDRLPVRSLRSRGLWGLVWLQLRLTVSLPVRRKYHL